jgi:hypothetical protein
MAATVTATLDTNIKFSEDSGNTFPALSVSPAWAPAQQQYSAGLLASNLDLAYMSRQSVASGTPVSLDVSGGGLKDLLGNTFSPAKIACIAIHNRGTAGNITITGNFMTSRFGASFSMVLTPGGRFVFDDPSLAGLAVTNSTADVITLTSSAGTNDVDIAIGGRSA